jgi:hypothetical protein
MMPDECKKKHVELEKFVELRVDTCRKEVSAELHQLNETLSEFAEAFPHTADGTPDFGGHRRYHDGLIRAAEAQTKFWDELRLDIVKKGTWGLLIIIIGLLVLGLQIKFGLLTR